MRIATLNVRTLARPADAQYLCGMAGQMGLDIVALQSTNRALSITIGEYAIYCNDLVGIIHRTALPIECDELCPRIMRVHLKDKDISLYIGYCPFSTTATQQQYWAQLTNCLALATTKTVLVLGDQNAHVTVADLQQAGHPFSHCHDLAAYPAATDPNGHALLDLCRVHTLTIMNFANRASFQQRITCRSPLATQAGTIIDYSIFRTSDSHMHVNGTTVKHQRYASDHNMVITHLSLGRAQKRPRPPQDAPTPAPPPLDNEPAATAYERAKRHLLASQAPPPPRQRRALVSPTTLALTHRFHTLWRRTRTYTPALISLRHQLRRAQRRDFHHFMISLAKEIQQNADARALHMAYRLLYPWTHPRGRRRPAATIIHFHNVLHDFRLLLQREIPSDWTPELLVTRPAPPAQPGETITLFTDGSWNQDQRLGWAYITPTYSAFGGAISPNATATRAEALAILAAMQHHRGIHLTICTDSANCISNFARIRRLINSGFTLTQDADIWAQIARELATHRTTVELVKVAAHTGVPENEACDTLAKIGMQTADGMWRLGHTTHEINGTHPTVLLNTRTPMAPFQWEGTPIPPLPLSDQPPTQAEIRKAINALKNRTAPGLDEIRPETLKQETAFSHICAAITEIWTTTTIPRDWKQTRLVSIPKKDGGHRGIAITSAFAKIVTRIILARYADTPLLDEQFAFRAARNTTQATLALKQMLHRRYATQQATHVLFVDVRKAYDSVSRELLEPLLQAYGVGPIATTLILQLYEDEIHVDVNGRRDPKSAFHSTCGVKQGCIVSPWLFTLVMDVVIRNVKQQRPHAQLFVYADDIAIVDYSLPSLAQTATCLLTELKRMGLEINTTKTELMSQTTTDTQDTMAGFASRLHKLAIPIGTSGAHTNLGRAAAGALPTEVLIPHAPGQHLACPFANCPYLARHESRTPQSALLVSHLRKRHRNAVSPLITASRLPAVQPNPRLTDTHRLIDHPPNTDTITLAHTPIKLCQSFRYLGTIISATGSDTPDITARIQAAGASMWKLKHFWSNNHIRRWFKAQLFKTLIVPVLLYNAGTWTPTEHDFLRLRGAYHNYARRAGVFKGTHTVDGWRKTSATTVRAHLRIPTLADALREERLRLFGQLVRLDTAICQATCQPCQNHQRRGKQPLCWLELLQKDLTALGLTAESPKERTWHKVIKAPRPGPPPAE